MSNSDWTSVKDVVDMHLNFTYLEIFEIRKHIPITTRKGPERLMVVTFLTS